MNKLVETYITEFFSKIQEGFDFAHSDIDVIDDDEDNAILSDIEKRYCNFPEWVEVKERSVVDDKSLQKTIHNNFGCGIQMMQSGYIKQYGAEPKYDATASQWKAWTDDLSNIKKTYKPTGKTYPDEGIYMFNIPGADYPVRIYNKRLVWMARNDSPAQLINILDNTMSTE